MELQGQTRIDAPRDRVWAALVDPEILARCMEGVETLESVGDNRFAGVLNARVGPVKARFTGAVEMTEMDPPNRYVLVGEGKGGVAGFAKGSAEVLLSEDPDGGTMLTYTARSQVGGKLAQLGTRLIEGTAKAYAESFFAAFRQQVEGPQPDMSERDGPAPADDEMVSQAASTLDEAIQGGGIPGWVWIGGLIAIVALVLLLLY